MEELLHKYFPEFTQLQISSLISLQELYADWNQKINVISRKDMDNFFVHHVLHSLSLVKVIHPKIHTILDVGTGGGFPGIPLAIAMPQIQFVLLDSIRKKVKVVHEIVQSLKLQNVTPLCDRMEHHQNRYDIIVSRAVAPTALLLSWTKHNTKKHTEYYLLKGGDLDTELSGISHCEVLELANLFDEDYFTTKKIVNIKV